MALTYSWPGVNGLATTTDARKALAGLIETDAAGNVRAGIFPSNANPIITARADMNIDIAIFQACAVQFGGPILFTNDGVANLPSLLVSPGSGNNFYVVYAKQNESTSPGSDANNNRVLGTVLSTTSFALARSNGTRMDGSGTGLPTGAVEIGTVQMPSLKTATNASGVVISQTCQYTAAEGGTVWVRDATELAAWTPTSGALAYRIDTKTVHRRDGSTWVEVGTANHAGRDGGAVTSVGIPSAPVALPAGVIVKTGQWVGGTTNAFGNEYFPTVSFATAFPNGVLYVGFTPLANTPVTRSVDTIVVDTLSAASFRALVTGSVNPWIRGYMWFAVGY